MRKKEKLGLQNGFKYYSGCLLIFISILMSSCVASKKMISYNDVDAIRFWYLPKHILTPASIIDCGDIVYDTLVNRDTVITDQSIIKRYVSIVNNLKPFKKIHNYDLRVTSLIKTKKEKIAVCISFNSVVLKDGRQMKASKEIFDFLDDILYNHLTNEDWTPDFMREGRGQ